MSFTIDEFLEGAARIGYDGVELNTDEGKINPFKISGGERAKIREKLTSLGLGLPMLCTWLQCNLASPEEPLRKRGVEIIKRECELASDLGAKIVGVEAAIASPQVPYKKLWEWSKSGLLEAAQTAADVGIHIAIENIWEDKFLSSPLEFKAFIDEINSDHVKAFLDIGNCMPVGFPQQWIEVLGKDILLVHAKDFDLQKLEYKPLLQGHVNWKAVIAALNGVGYDYFIDVEVGPYPGHPTKSAVDSKLALDIILHE